MEPIMQSSSTPIAFRTCEGPSSLLEQEEPVEENESESQHAEEDVEPEFSLFSKMAELTEMDEKVISGSIPEEEK